MLHEHTDAYERYLRDRAGELTGEVGHPSQVTLQPLGSAITAALSFGPRTHRVVIKPVKLSRDIGSAAKLGEVITSLRTMRHVGAALPEVLGFDERLKLIVFPWVEGRPLEPSIVNYIRDGGTAPTSDVVAIGHLLSQIERHDAAAIFGREARSPMTFLETFHGAGRVWARAASDAGFASGVQYFESFSRAFLESAGTGLLLADSQPKNIIVRTDSSLCFIDLNFAAAPVGVAAAGFLVAMDRLAIRCQSRQQQRRLTELQREFIRAFSTGRDSLVEHVAFFYPWTLLEMLSQHVSTHPRLQPWLRMYYRNRLSRFLLAVRDGGGVASAASAAAWFEPSTADWYSRLGSLITRSMGTLGRLRT